MGGGREEWGSRGWATEGGAGGRDGGKCGKEEWGQRGGGRMTSLYSAGGE